MFVDVSLNPGFWNFLELGKAAFQWQTVDALMCLHSVARFVAVIGCSSCRLWCGNAVSKVEAGSAGRSATVPWHSAGSSIVPRPF